MQFTPVTPHETLYLHEILTLKNTCAAKSSALQNMVRDPELKEILHQDTAAAKRQIQDIQNTLSPAVFCRQHERGDDE